MAENFRESSQNFINKIFTTKILDTPKRGGQSFVMSVIGIQSRGFWSWLSVKVYDNVNLTADINGNCFL